jgi:hypothetical protein
MLTHAASVRIKTMNANGFPLRFNNRAPVAQNSTMECPRALHHQAIPRLQNQKSILSRSTQSDYRGE